MQVFDEQGIAFAFPDDFVVFRPQHSVFYRKLWQRFSIPDAAGEKGNKEADFVAVDRKEQRLWLIEAKDYRVHERTKPGSLSQEFARKCRDSLALLAALQLSSTAAEVGETASGLLDGLKKVSCVLHVEQKAGEKLFPLAVRPTDLKDALRRELHALDPQALTGTAAELATLQLPFTITV